MKRKLILTYFLLHFLVCSHANASALMEKKGWIHTKQFNLIQVWITDELD